MLEYAPIDRDLDLEGTPARCGGATEVQEAAVRGLGASPEQVSGTRMNAVFAARAALALRQESGQRRSDLAGLKILLVEDEFFVAVFIENILRDLGCTVVGPSAGVAEAIGTVAAESFDAAVLDINLDGEYVYPVADLLLEIGTPFVFSTGYAALDLPERYRRFRRVRKPFNVETLKREILALW